MFEFKQVGRWVAPVLSRRGLGVAIAVLACSACASTQPRSQAQREVQFCQGANAQSVQCGPADIRALERAIFGLPGQRR
jgi:hypothetical protein